LDPKTELFVVDNVGEDMAATVRGTERFSDIALILRFFLLVQKILKLCDWDLRETVTDSVPTLSLDTMSEMRRWELLTDKTVRDEPEAGLLLEGFAVFSLLRRSGRTL